MPLTAKGKKIKTAMQKQYGPETGERVFYAAENAGSITGVAKRAAGGAARGDGCCQRGRTRGTVVRMNAGGKPWATPNPKPKTERTTLSAAQKTQAKRAAAAAGRPYPNLVDNMRAAATRKG